ncbi:MAG: hypothetical protein DRH12_10380 [Deltaproteobacteria bacterium]|nr:MAG: hypothetical protein DRH12_10380 [Deltaproteobacteria bacterium]
MISFKTALVSGILICFLFFTAICFLTPEAQGQIAAFEVISVPQGDTIQIKVKDTKISVQLVGIDAPEFCHEQPYASQPFAKEARDYLAWLVKGKRVRIKSYASIAGRYMLAEVFLDNKNISLEMVKAGYAELYRGVLPPGFNPELYREIERLARTSKRGIWVQGDKYESPMDWCKRRRAKRACSMILFGIVEQGNLRK